MVDARDLKSLGGPALCAGSIPASGKTDRATEMTDSAIRDLVKGESLELVVAGDCMRPLAVDGSRVAIRAPRRIFPGDVVVYRSADGRLLVHRVLGYRIKNRRIEVVTRGDRSSSFDSPVSLNALLGVVVMGGDAPELSRVSLLTRWRSVCWFLLWIGEGLARRARRSGSL